MRVFGVKTAIFVAFAAGITAATVESGNQPQLASARVSEAHQIVASIPTPAAPTTQPMAPTPVSPYEPLDQAILCMEYALYHEVRGEPELGQRMVAHVIHERAKQNIWYWGGNTICGVVFYRKFNAKTRKIVCQFEFVCRPKIMNRVYYDQAALKRAREIAKDQLAGKFVPPAHLVGARSYMWPAKSTPRGRGYFKRLEYLDTIGVHQFYALAKL